MIQQSGPNPYLKTKILTASPEELRLMLYEGAIKFCRQAKSAMAKKDRERGFESLMKAQKIVLELSTSLKHEIAPELCSKLSALYTYIYRRLVDANMAQDPAVVDEAISLLEYEKNTWEMLISKLAHDRGAPATKQDQTDFAAAQQTAISSLSLNG